MKKIWIDLFFLIATFLMFLLESGGFGTGIVLAFVIAVVMLGSDRWGAVTGFVGGFLLDLILRPVLTGSTASIFLLFNLTYQFIARYTKVGLWYKLLFSFFCVSAYYLYLFLPMMSIDWVNFLLKTGGSFFLTWFFYFILENSQKFLKTESHLQLSLKV